MDAIGLIFTLAILIFSVIAHEVAHGYAADALGDPTARYAGRLTLNPISHADPIGSLLLPVLGFISGGFIFGWAKPVPYNPGNLSYGRLGEALVALAGPFTNISLAVLFSLFIRLFGDALSPAFVELAFTAVVLNLVLAVFNLIPIPPSDGSKILFSLLPWRLHYLERAIEPYGLILLLIFVLLLWKTFFPVIWSLASTLAG